MASHIDRAVASVLTRSKLKLAHPGASQLHEFYATPSSCSSHLAESIQSYNRLRVVANNLLLASQTNFVISTSSIVTSLWLHVSITGAAGFKLPTDGWLFQAINSIEVTFSNSLLQNMIIYGPALRDYLLATCKNRTDRERLLKLAGQGSYNVVARASMPIGHILASAAFQSGNYGIDFSVLNGPVNLQINWNPAYKFVVKANGGFAAPAAWTSCEITGMTSDLVDSSFAVKTAMAQNPALIYSTPGKYINSFTYNLAGVNVGAQQTINLQSAPAGMLCAILLNIRPAGAAADGGGPPRVQSSDWTGIAAGTALVHGESVNLSTLTLSYGGQNLLDLRTEQEIVAMLTSAFDGDDMSYDIISCRQADTDNLVGEQVYHTRILVIPFGYDMRKILSYKLTENLPGYAGASMQLSFTVAQGTYSTNATPYTVAADPQVIQAGLAYNVQVTYILDSLVEVSQGTVDLQM
jgi:hypothetical protein